MAGCGGCNVPAIRNNPCPAPEAPVNLLKGASKFGVGLFRRCCNGIGVEYLCEEYPSCCGMLVGGMWAVAHAPVLSLLLEESPPMTGMAENSSQLALMSLIVLSSR